MRSLQGVTAAEAIKGGDGTSRAALGTSVVDVRCSLGLLWTRVPEVRVTSQNVQTGTVCST